MNAAYEIGRKQTVRGGSPSGVGKKDRGRTSENEQSRRMLVALALLMIAIAVVAFRDRQYLFEAGSQSDRTQQTAVPVSSEPNGVASESNAVASSALRGTPMTSTAATVPEASQKATVQAAQESAVPVGKKDTGDRSGLALKLSVPAKKDSAAAVTAQAAQRAHMAQTTVQNLEPETALYPRLDQRTKVEGSVELQALVGTDGAIQELHVVRGPAVLGSAAREAVLQWKFKPYTQNGVAVETYARITVNFTIRVVDGSPKTVASVEPEHVIILADNYQR